MCFHQGDKIIVLCIDPAGSKIFTLSLLGELLKYRELDYSIEYIGKIISKLYLMLKCNFEGDFDTDLYAGLSDGTVSVLQSS